MTAGGRGTEWSGGGPALVRSAAAVVLRPRLWAVAAATVLRLAAPGWWRRWPPLPVPDPAYWRHRMVTAYGDQVGSSPAAEDVVDYLDWCRGASRSCRRRARWRLG